MQPGEQAVVRQLPDRLFHLSEGAGTRIRKVRDGIPRRNGRHRRHAHEVAAVAREASDLRRRFEARALHNRQNGAVVAGHRRGQRSIEEPRVVLAGGRGVMTWLDWIVTGGAGPELLARGRTESFLRCWEFYFAYCEGGFRERRIGDVQVLDLQGDLVAGPEAEALAAIARPVAVAICRPAEPRAAAPVPAAIHSTNIAAEMPRLLV